MSNFRYLPLNNPSLRTSVLLLINTGAADVPDFHFRQGKGDRKGEKYVERPLSRLDFRISEQRGVR